VSFLQHHAFLVKRGCLLCGVKGFDNYPTYVAHIDSPEHKKVTFACSLMLLKITVMIPLVIIVVAVF